MVLNQKWTSSWNWSSNLLNLKMQSSTLVIMLLGPRPPTPSQMAPWQVLPLWVRVDQGLMSMKEYFQLTGPPEVEPHYQMQFSDIPSLVIYLNLKMQSSTLVIMLLGPRPPTPSQMAPWQVLPLWVRVDQGLMSMKEYFQLTGPPEVEPHYQMQFSDIPSWVIYLNLKMQSSTLVIMLLGPRPPNSLTDGTLTGTTTLGQSRPGINVNERVLPTYWTSRSRTTLSDAV